MNRRDFIKKATLAGIASAGVVQSLDKFTASAVAPSELIIAQNGEPEALLRAALAAYGGLGKVVRRGMTVVIKANFSWMGKPEQACCTNPDLLAALVKECLKTGAKKVKVVDLAIDPAKMSLDISGIKKAVEAAGGEAENLDNAPNVERKCGDLDKFRIYEIALKADCLINVPILKHHSSTMITAAMKNYMGLTPDRAAMHTLGTDNMIVELAKIIKPHLHILDAYRVLKTRGPKGPGQVENLKQLVVSNDPVAVDSYGATIINVEKNFLPYTHIGMAAKAGLGTMDLSKVKITKVKC